MRIDAHQHFWKYDSAKLPWVANLPAIRRDFFPTNLKPRLDEHQLDGCIIAQTQHNIEETEWFLELAEEHYFIKGVVGWVDLQSDHVSEDLGRLSESGYLKSIRHQVEDEDDENFHLRPKVLEGMAQLSKFDLAYDLGLTPFQMPAANELVRKFPNQRFVICHLAKPKIKAQLLEPWKTEFLKLAECDNVHCKLSGMVTEADWDNWQPSDFLPYTDTLLSAFGPERILYGSDWPVCLLAANYSAVYDLAQACISKLSPSEQSLIMGKNAVSFYDVT